MCSQKQPNFLNAPESFDNSLVMDETKSSYHRIIVWPLVLFYILLHVSALYGIYLSFTSTMWQTNVFAVFVLLASGGGITAGAHRLWSHRSYKAKLPLRIFLAFLNTIAFEKDIHNWARDHRVHHKFTETDADPHNAKRGFFFSHVGWLMVRKHPEVLEKGKTVDLSDVLEDPVVKFQIKYYVILVLLCCFVLPTYLPMFLWRERFLNAFLVPTILRYTVMLNSSWLINSAAHMFGDRPYDKHINPRDNHWLVMGFNGEGFHNYHHTFPWDYASSEFGLKYDFTAVFIKLMEWLGQAYDLKTVSPEMVKDRKMRTGDGTHLQAEHFD